MSKYRAIKTNGYSSKKEAKRADELRLMERAGLVVGIREQVVYTLAPSVIVHGRKRPPLRYIADFVYLENGEEVCEDVKGIITPVYRIKRHLMKSVHGIDIKET